MEREEKIKAIMNRDSSYDGKFCYGVKSTALYANLHVRRKIHSKATLCCSIR